jgi:hypothetical protein
MFMTGATRWPDKSRIGNFPIIRRAGVVFGLIAANSRKYTVKASNF